MRDSHVPIASSGGTTILELLLAVAIVCAAVAMLSLFFSKASMATAEGQRRWFANNFASARVQEWSAQPYAQIPVTPSGTYFTNTNNSSPSAAFPVACDCATVNWGALETDVGVDATYTEMNVAFKRQVCVNLVDHKVDMGVPKWLSYCPDDTSATDKGLKKIRVRVSWGTGQGARFIQTESMVSR